MAKVGKKGGGLMGGGWGARWGIIVESPSRAFVTQAVRKGKGGGAFDALTTAVSAQQMNLVDNHGGDPDEVQQNEASVRQAGSRNCG